MVWALDDTVRDADVGLVGEDLCDFIDCCLNQSVALLALDVPVQVRNVRVYGNRAIRLEEVIFG